MKNTKFEVLHILAALGAAGMTASFFFAVNFMTSHPGNVFIDFNTLNAQYLGQTDLLSLFIQLYIVAAVGSAILHFVLLYRWFKGFQKYRLTEEYKQLLNSNKEVQLMAIPLTLTMTMNVFFILGAIFIPGLFDKITLLGMEMQLIDAMLIGAGLYFSWVLYLALKIFNTYFLRLTDGKLDFVANSNLSQLLALFAFGMIAVGFGALSLSKIPVIALIGTSIASIVLALTIILAMLKFTLGMKSIFENGLQPGATVTLLIPITVIAMIVVGWFRADIGALHAFSGERDTTFHLLLFTIGAGVSIMIGIFGLIAMKKKGFFKKMNDKELDSSALALICPGFALEVQLVLWLSVGLVFSGVIIHGSTAYFALWIPMLILQWATITFYFKLLKNNQYLRFNYQSLAEMPKANIA